MEMLVFTIWEDYIFCLDPFHPALGEPNHTNWFLVTNSWGSPSMHLDGKELGEFRARKSFKHLKMSMASFNSIALNILWKGL